jgi:hypothetical protein
MIQSWVGGEFCRKSQPFMTKVKVLYFLNDICKVMMASLECIERILFHKEIIIVFVTTKESDNGWRNFKVVQ